MSSPTTDDILTILRDTTRNTPYENRLFLVGGYVRDKILQRATDSATDDLDLVLEGDAAEVANLLWRRGAADHSPVVFPTFGTAMVHIKGSQVEFVTARAETYRQGSRKPIVVPGNLQTDAERRDFTVNTFLENLHSGEILDPLGRAYDDLAKKILVTPLDPAVTFTDDPLRMMRACRFTAKLGFTVDENVVRAIKANAYRLTMEYGISPERVRDELNKTLLTSKAESGITLMLWTGLLDVFAPEIADMYKPSPENPTHAGRWISMYGLLHKLPADSTLALRLCVLFMYSGYKTDAQRTMPSPFYDVAEMKRQREEAEETEAATERSMAVAGKVMARLRYPNADINHVTRMIEFHAIFDYRSQPFLDNAYLRRLLVTMGDLRREIFALHDAYIAIYPLPNRQRDYLDSVRDRLDAIALVTPIETLTSPLSGNEIIATWHLRPGSLVGKIKEILTDAVIDGLISPSDKAAATDLINRAYSYLLPPA